MFEYNDELKTSRAAHDAPVSPRPIWERRGISQAEHEEKRKERAIRKDASIRTEANDALDRAIRRIAEYSVAANANIRDLPLLRYYTFRYKQLKENVGKLTAELLLGADNTINPQKTIVFYTGLIRDLLNTPVEMPKSSIHIMTQAEYKRALDRSKAMSPAVWQKPAKAEYQVELLSPSEWERLNTIALEKKAKT